MITKQQISDIDKSDLFSVIRAFPSQVEDACSIGQNAPFFDPAPVSGRFIVLGMGGSAIGGDLIRAYIGALESSKNFKIEVNRNYDIPTNICENDNIIVSSYSGNTEETISGLKQALLKTKRIICITTGGEIERIANENSLPVIKVPTGFQPRAALGYSFFPMLYTMLKTNFIVDKEKSKITAGISSTISMLKKKSDIYSNYERQDNFAVQIAKTIHGTIPVIYSAYGLLETVNLRWRGQIQENAKNAAFGNYLPEMNHNEINSWQEPSFIKDNLTMIMLKDKSDNIRTKIRFAAIDEILTPMSKSSIGIESEYNTAIERMFDMLYLGDWVSFYLAILNKQDPTPIPLILKLKDILSKK